MAVMLAALLMATSTPMQSPEIHDVIHLDRERQVVENFGASDCWTIQTLGSWSDENRNRLADLLFSKTKGIGLSLWRFNIGGGFNPRISRPERTSETFEVSEGVYDWTRQATPQWFLSAAKDRGVKQFLAFANTPPARLTRNGLTFGTPGKDSTNLQPGMEAAYARYLVDILQHFRKNKDRRLRIPFDFVSPVNEPQWAWEDTKQEGNRAGNADIKRIVLALGAELKRQNDPAKITLVESGSIPDMYALDGGATRKWGIPYGNYADALIGDLEVAPLMSGRIGYHAYFSDLLSGDILRHREALRRKMDEHKDWKLWQTEYCILQGPEGKGGGGRDLTMKTALDVARVIHLDLTVAGVSAWQWWLALSMYNFKDGLVYTDYQKPGDPQTIYPSKLLWTLGNYSRFIRPGMQRVELEGESRDLRGLLRSAYKDERARRVVAVYVNEGETPQPVDLNFDLGKRHWKVRSLTRYLTSDTAGDDLRAEKVTDIEVPARSVATFVAQF